MATESKEKALAEKIDAVVEPSDSYCADCMLSWCYFRGKVVYCSLKYRGVRGFYCENNRCQI